MTIRWRDVTECYEFDTGTLFGAIQPFGHYHGVAGLMHRSRPLDLVRPMNAFLNAEYYIRPGVDRKMLPRDISRGRRTTRELREDSVILHFPPEPEYAFDMDLIYTPGDDAIDMEMRITPTRDVPGFEIFFASYVCEALDETWVPLRGPDGTREWVKLNNRRSLNEIFGIMREQTTLELLPEQYPGHAVKVEQSVFAEPILVARDSTDGLALVFLCDPHLTKYLAGQYHGWDTAHDWSFGADLQKGRAIVARTRMVCRPIRNVDHMSDEVAELWSAFEKGRR